MATIKVGLGDVKGFRDLPKGTYFAEISKMTYREKEGNAKGDSIMVQYTVLDEGKELGSTATEFLHLSEKALPRTKRWFDKFGLGDTDEFDVDDDTNDLLEPDLIGTQVIIESYEDKPKPGETEKQIRIKLVSVESEVDSSSADDDDDDEDEEDEKPAPKAKKRTRREEPEEDDEEDEDDEEEDDDDEEEEKPRKKVAARKPAVKAAAKKRRTLR